MTKKQLLIIADKYAELYPALGREHLLSGALMDELNYVHLKCIQHPEIVPSVEFQKVVDYYTIDGITIPESIIKYKDILLQLKKPQWYNVNHYELNDSVSYIGEYYDGTPTSKYRKRGRFRIDPIILS